MRFVVFSAVIVGLLAGCGGPDPEGGARQVAPTTSERSRDFGEYVLHYNALTTDMLPAEVASTFNISRSKSRAMLNIVMLRKVEGTLGQAVEGTVVARTSNLTGQLKNLPLRPVVDGDAIYYIGEIGVTDGEVLIFDIEAKPEGSETPMQVKFQQQFFTR
ncbi:MAG: DUF4426 domain-containing protein [Gammaproteobacteria bacterium]|nr:DUF4426 domain-containing protein [Gammaproteobacteria bacterium]